MVFSLKPQDRFELFGEREANIETHLAYVEWFTKFTALPDPHHRMYRISRSYRDVRTGSREAEIVPLTRIKRSIHLIPRFGLVADRSWTSANVLEECDVFYVNPFTDNHAYVTL